MKSAAPHIPVMLGEVLSALSPRDGETYIDGTLGAGGYTRAILGAANCNVMAFDRDQTAHDMAATWGKAHAPRLTLIKSSFSNIEEELTHRGIEKVDAIVLDLNSSMQLDEGDRGFSFRFNAPLDMRMDRASGKTAADLVNALPEKELADIIYLYGEERHSRRIAAAIVKRRVDEKIETTAQLAEIVRSVLPFSPKDKSDPATRTFQALRIAVNDELGELETVLEASEKLLKENGRLIVVTFHSLEDRIVKDFLNKRSKPAPSPSRHAPSASDVSQNRLSFSLLSKKPVLPTEKRNKRKPSRQICQTQSGYQEGIVKKFVIKLSTVFVLLLVICRDPRCSGFRKKSSSLSVNSASCAKKLQAKKKEFKSFLRPPNGLSEPSGLSEALAAKYLGSTELVAPENLLQNANAIPEKSDEEEAKTELVPANFEEEKAE